MNTSIISLLLSFSLLSATPVGRAGKWVSPTAFHTYVEIVGKKQGQLKPQESKGKRDGTWIEVMSYNFNGDRAGDPTVGGHGNGTQKSTQYYSKAGRHLPKAHGSLQRQRTT